MAGLLAPSGFLGQRGGQLLRPPPHLRLRLLQFPNPVLKRPLLRCGFLRLRLLLLARHLQSPLQLRPRLLVLRQLRFELAPLPAQRRHLLLRPLPAVGFLRQRRRQLLHPPLDRQPGRLQLLHPRLQPTLLTGGTLQQRLPLFLHFPQLLLQFRSRRLLLRQRPFQLRPLPGLPRQRLSQLLYLLFRFGLGRLQLRNSRHQLALLRPGAFTLDLQLLADLLQLLPHLP